MYIYSCLSTGNSYKFKVGTKANALRWYTYVREATKEKLDYKVSMLWFTVCKKICFSSRVGKTCEMCK